MSKSHVIDLTIFNRTPQTLVFDHAWFQTGGLADGNEWPGTIPAGRSAVVECCESSWSPVGCSGWVSYVYGETTLYLAFSNPLAGGNGIDIGTTPGVWNVMTSHYFPVERVFDAGGTWLAVEIVGTGGTVNQATWNIFTPDVTDVVPANPEMTNVPRSFAQVPADGVREYYECPTAPTSVAALFQSHFKGIASFSDKLIFTHTDLDPLTPAQNGAYLIADRIISGNQGMVEAIYPTLHPGWPHPCSAQACGSFMAMGIQAAASGEGSKVSEIQILDIRMARVNQRAQVIGTVPRPDDGVNGVGMTKETGPDGKYIVAGLNGQSLTVYRSRSSSLMGGQKPEFDPIYSTGGFPDSGAGLALITQADGKIFMVALNADDSGANNTATLYFLDLQSPTPSYLQVAKKAMNIPGMSESVLMLEKFASLVPLIAVLLQTIGAPLLNSSFRWGKGVGITSPTTLEVYASDRNDLSLSSIPGHTLTQDYGIVVWSSGKPAD